MPKVDLAKLKLDDFSKHLNATFTMDAGGGKTVPLTLVQATAHTTELPATVKGTENQDLKTRKDGGFTLDFQAPEGRVLRQGTYTIEHPTMGKMDIFVSPSGVLPNGGAAYHAVFN